MTYIGGEYSLGIFTLRAKNKTFDESVQKILKLSCVVGAIDDVAVILGVKLGLGTQLASKVLAWI